MSVASPALTGRFFTTEPPGMNTFEHLLNARHSSNALLYEVAQSSFLNFYLFLAALGLHCCAWAFSSCSKWGLLSSCSAQASHCGSFSCQEHGL